MQNALRKFPDGGKIYFSVISEVPVQSDSAEVKQDSTAGAEREVQNRAAHLQWAGSRECQKVLRPLPQGTISVVHPVSMA